MTTASPARIAANRRNSQKSTGPRTAEGKARSRANAVKHGLTGAGVALPGEDQVAIQERFLQIQEELAPATLLGAELAHDLALLTVRRRRCARAEAAHLRTRVRHATAEFDRARTDHADRLLDAIEAHPRAYRRELLAMPEGIDRLAEALAILRDDLTGPVPAWSEAHHKRLDALFGFRVADLPWNRPTRFSRAVLGDFEAIGDDEVAHLPGADDRWAWAVERLVATIEAELAGLAEHRAAIDRRPIELDRDDAADRALADPGREVELARRYAAAAGREFARALRDFHIVEADAPADPTPEPGAAPEPGPADVPLPDQDPAQSLPVEAARPASPEGPSSTDLAPADAEHPSAQDRPEVQEANPPDVPLASFGAADSGAARGAGPARTVVPRVAFTPAPASFYRPEDR